MGGRWGVLPLPDAEYRTGAPAAGTSPPTGSGQTVGRGTREAAPAVSPAKAVEGRLMWREQRVWALCSRGPEGGGGCSSGLEGVMDPVSLSQHQPPVLRNPRTPVRRLRPSRLHCCPSQHPKTAVPSTWPPASASASQDRRRCQPATMETGRFVIARLPTRHFSLETSDLSTATSRPFPWPVRPAVSVHSLYRNRRAWEPEAGSERRLVNHGEGAAACYTPMTRGTHVTPT